MIDIYCPDCDEFLFSVKAKVSKEVILKEFSIFQEIQCRNCEKWHRVENLLSQLEK